MNINQPAGPSVGWQVLLSHGFVADRVGVLGVSILATFWRPAVVARSVPVLDKIPAIPAVISASCPMMSGSWLPGAEAVGISNADESKMAARGTVHAKKATPTPNRNVCHLWNVNRRVCQNPFALPGHSPHFCFTRRAAESTPSDNNVRRRDVGVAGGVNLLNLINLQNLIPKVVNHLHCDLAGRGLRERSAGGAVERAPGGFVDFGAEGSLEFLVGLIGAGEIGLRAVDRRPCHLAKPQNGRRD